LGIMYLVGGFKILQNNFKSGDIGNGKDHWSLNLCGRNRMVNEFHGWQHWWAWYIARTKYPRQDWSYCWHWMTIHPSVPWLECWCTRVAIKLDQHVSMNE
jgi:hypothetical protein